MRGRQVRVALLVEPGRQRVVLAGLRRLHQLAQERMHKAHRRVDGEERRVAGARDADVHDAALLLDLRRLPARDVAVVVGDDDRVVFATLCRVDGADDDAVLLGLLARQRVVGHALVGLLVGEQAVPGAQVGGGVGIGLREQEERVEDLERAGAVGAGVGSGAAARGRRKRRVRPGRLRPRDRRPPRRPPPPSARRARRPRRPSTRGPRRCAGDPRRRPAPLPARRRHPRRGRRGRRRGAARPQAPWPRAPVRAPTAVRLRRRPPRPRGSRSGSAG